MSPYHGRTPFKMIQRIIGTYDINIFVKDTLTVIKVILRFLIHS